MRYLVNRQLSRTGVTATVRLSRMVGLHAWARAPPPTACSPEVRARLAQTYSALEGKPVTEAAAVEASPPGQTALFNNWEDAVECARCGGRMVRTGSGYTCRDCGTNTGCS